jgi:alpha-L-fucosidase
MERSDINSIIYYTTDGSEPNKESLRYERPFVFATKGTIRAVCYDANFDRLSPVTSIELDIPATAYRIIEPSDDRAGLIFDGNGYTAFRLPKEKPELILELVEEKTMTGFRYTPNQRRDAVDYIIRYQFYIDGNKVSEGEFSNIVNNPVMQEIRFQPTKGKNIRFVATSVVNDVLAGIGEFSVITE